MAIILNLKKSMFVPKFYDWLLDYENRWVFMCGSAGSGKSYTIAQKIIIRCCREPIKVLVCRRYASTLRNSCFSLFKEILAKWQLTQYVKIRETDMSIIFSNGSQIIMCGLDTEEKLLSLNNISTVWVEEAYEVEESKISQLNLRMRGTANNQQIILSWNPISRHSWLYNFTVENPPENSRFIHSTFKDNPFLGEEYVRALNELYTRNPQKARVFCDGEWGIDTDGLVIRNFQTADFDFMALASSGLEHRCGMDLGWVDPSAITNTLYDRDNKIIYVFEEFYKSGCQLSELATAIGKMNIGKTKLYIDASEPRTIQFFKSQGINAYPCKKGKDSVRAGLMFLQDHKIIVHPSCQNLIRELENFSYIKSKITGEYTEDTTHEYSHSIDSLKYAYSDIYTQTKLKTLDKSILGL